MVNKNIPPIPKEIKVILDVYVEVLNNILGEKLYGVYMYGASVFPDSGPIQDIDCHVILREKLSQDQREAIMTAYQVLGEKYPGLGEELDAYVILLADAKKRVIPQHQVIQTIYDEAWALHCAHIRAGYYRVIWGPDPIEIFPAPSWEAVKSALDHELAFVMDNLRYPAYCILNLCRILYSYETKNPVVSKQFCGDWGSDRFPQWADVIRAAMRFYRKEHKPEDVALMESQLEAFLAFMIDQIKQVQ